MARYRLRLMFEWGGGCLWCGDDATRARFGVGPVEERLPLSQDTRERLAKLSARHDTALNWDDPPAPSPWTAEENAAFDAAAQELLERISAELGSDFIVIYAPL
jgi:hypothetical protein